LETPEENPEDDYQITKVVLLMTVGAKN